MATTQLADLYNPLVFGSIAQEKQTEGNAFIASGIMANDAQLATMASVGGTIGELTQYKPLDFLVEPTYQTDVVGDKIGTEKVSIQTMNYRRFDLARAWSFAELAKVQALQSAGDPVEAVANRIGAYWASVEQQRVIKSSLGILADCVANHGSDMIISVATDAVGGVVDAERISANVILDAKQTMGDMAEDLGVLAVHSVTYTRLKKENLIDTVVDSEGKVSFMSYMGMRLVVDDSLPAVAGANRITYTSILFGGSAYAYAQVPRVDAMATERDEKAGNGSGETSLIHRMSGIIHPLGYSMTSNNLNTDGQVGYSQLEMATTFTRVWQRKNIKLAFIQTND